MITLETLTAFFGWCTIINFGFLSLTAIVVGSGNDWVKNIHSKLYKVSREDLDPLYFKFLAYLKLLVIVFNLTPWIALKLLA